MNINITGSIESFAVCFSVAWVITTFIKAAMTMYYDKEKP